MAERQPGIVPETSSQPSVIPEQQLFLFREILELLEKKKIPFAVAGAFALRQHTGISRDTKDLDIFCKATQTDIRSQAAVLRLLKLVLASAGHPVQEVQVSGPGVNLSSIGPDGASFSVIRS